MSEIPNFNLLDLPFPEIIKSYSILNQQEIFEYLQQIEGNDKKAYLIAFDHLGSSFNIYKSNGFKEWKQKNKLVS